MLHLFAICLMLFSGVCGYYEGQSYYQILGVAVDAPQRDIKRAYRALALTFHPDKVTPESKADAEARFTLISEAYNMLSDAEKHAQYDMLLSLGKLRWTERAYEAMQYQRESEFHEKSRGKYQRTFEPREDPFSGIKLGIAMCGSLLAVVLPLGVMFKAKQNGALSKAAKKKAMVERVDRDRLKALAETEQKEAQAQALRLKREEKKRDGLAKAQRRAKTKSPEEMQRKRHETELRALKTMLKKTCEDSPELQDAVAIALQFRKSELRSLLKAMWAHTPLLPAPHSLGLNKELQIPLKQKKKPSAGTQKPASAKGRAAAMALVRATANEVKDAKANRKRAALESAKKAEAVKAWHKEQANKPWSKVELSALAKAMAKYPGGTPNRWDLVATMVNASSDVQRTAKQVIVQTKKLESEGLNIGSSSQSTVDTPEATAADAQEGGEEEWSPVQQAALEQALRSVPKTDERWDVIVTHVPGKTKKQCVDRYREIQAKIKARAQ